MFVPKNLTWMDAKVLHNFVTHGVRVQISYKKRKPEVHINIVILLCIKSITIQFHDKEFEPLFGRNISVGAYLHPYWYQH